MGRTCCRQANTDEYRLQPKVRTGPHLRSKCQRKCHARVSVPGSAPVDVWPGRPKMVEPVIALLLSAAVSLSPQALWDVWPSTRFVSTPAPCLKPAELYERLQALEAKHRARLKVEEAGRSFEGRPIHLMTVGTGPRKVLLWARMHGDEPSATPALLDLADHLLSRRDDPSARRILEAVTLLMVPMLNPDGAERYERRNAQGIDVNRDALNLATPEGRLLKTLRDRHRPVLGFNLHDQNRHTTVGDTGRLATIALLGVAGDARGTLTPGRRRARRACAAIAAALAPLLPAGGGISRYDEDWSPRAFGDNLTKWGTPVVLVESGGLPPGFGHAELTRLNFVGLLAALDGLARDDLAGHREQAYEALKRNTRGVRADVVVRGGRLHLPGREPFAADLAFDVLVPDQVRAGCAGASGRGSRLLEVGDARFLKAGRTVDAAGAVIVPGIEARVRGLAARSWLTAGALDAMARLGVVSVLWEVGPPDYAEAGRVTAELEADGRPPVRAVLERAGGEAGGAGLEVSAAPRNGAPTLGAALQALSADAPVSWSADGLPRRLAGGGRAFVPEARASFLVLRPSDGATDPLGMALDTVWIEGRPAPAR